MQFRPAILPALSLALIATAILAAEPATIWWEAEAAIKHNFPEGTPYGPQSLDSSKLSGGDWLSATANRYGPALFAQYHVEVAKADTYTFWVRKFWKHGPFRWRFDYQPWQHCTRQIALADSVYMRKFVCANWVSLGTVKLDAGEHMLFVECTDAVEVKPEVEAKAIPPITDKRITKALTDWCTITYPTDAAVGQKLPVKIQYNVPEKTRLCCEMLWKKTSGGFGGFMTSGRPFPEVEGKGEYTFHMLVKDKGGYLGRVFLAVYLSKVGNSKQASLSLSGRQQPHIPVDPASIPKKVVGASAFGLDCFLLTTRPFTPRGKLKPGEKYNRADPGWFPFEPDHDAFTEDALLDLRSLNHHVCGEKGPLRASGEHLVFSHEPDRPVKFWGSCVGSGTVLASKSAVDHFARRLAKRGLNLVRLHGAFHGGVEGDRFAISDRFLDHFNYFVAALRRNGLYLMLNTYYDHFFAAGEDEVKRYGYKLGQHMPHWQFIHPEGQALWKRWVTRLLTARNPYTDLVNAQDPTIAFVQLVNEDNYFWYTFRPYATIPAPVMRHLEDRFRLWLERKYGSLEKATEAWGPDGNVGKVRGDDLAAGRLGLISAGGLQRSGRNPQRRCDSAQFLTEDLSAVFASFQNVLKQNLGYGGLVNAGNWICANKKVLEPLDKYANLACDMLDRHGYGWYKGPIRLQKSWAYGQGDLFRSLSPLRDPEGTPAMDTQYNHKPHIVSEPKSPMPNRFRSDWLPLLAIYGRIQGTDAFAHFAGGANWAQRHGRWTFDSPAQLGQSPALSLIFRRGYVQEGPVVIEEHLKLGDLYALKGAADSGTLGLDEMTVANITGDGLGDSDLRKIDPLAFFVGKVERHITAAGGVSRMADLARYIDRERKLIKSANGQVRWHYGQGLVTLNAPQAQGAFGFFDQAQPCALADVIIDPQNEYGSIFVVSLDGAPLATSKRILLQVMSEDLNYGWKTEPAKGKTKIDGKMTDVDCERILDTGTAPIQVKNLAGAVTLKRPDAEQLAVTALDFNGYRKEALPAGRGGTIQVQFLPDCLYYIIMRR